MRLSHHRRSLLDRFYIRRLARRIDSPIRSRMEDDWQRRHFSDKFPPMPFWFIGDAGKEMDEQVANVVCARRSIMVSHDAI